MRKITFSYIIILLLLLSCDKKDGPLMMNRLQQWDKVLEINPEAVFDSLQTLNPATLSSENKAYYGLLKTITDDKTYVDFTSDVQIKEAESYYRTHTHGSNLHIRSLVYLSIVRSRMGIADSTVLIPLKEAEMIFSDQEEQSASTGYLLNFFLGEIHKNNNNLITTDKYLQKALLFAKEENNKSHIFDTYLALYWNNMKQEKYSEGKKYLDSLEALSPKSTDELYFLLNAQSVYYDTQKLYEESIKKEKEQIKLFPFIKEKPDIFRLYYSISDQYSNLNKLDSALMYGVKAIEHVTDTLYQFNYLLYENVANIFEKKNGYQMANYYRKQASEIHRKIIDKEIDTNIFELEKQYDLSQSENKALQAEAKTRIAIIVILCLIILLIIFIFYIQTRKIKAKQEKKRLEEEKIKMEMEKKLI